MRHTVLEILDGYSQGVCRRTRSRFGQRLVVQLVEEDVIAADSDGKKYCPS
jgi:hypothetical protein